MRTSCPDLTELTIDSGHWIALEKPRETNAAIVKWLVTRVSSYWPSD
jgi:soluble epoxide hydrolase/lipid-phosphate phosphatase